MTLTSQTQNLLEIDHGYSVEGKMQKKKEGTNLCDFREGKDVSPWIFIYTIKMINTVVLK